MRYHRRGVGYGNQENEGERYSLSDMVLPKEDNPRHIPTISP